MANKKWSEFDEATSLSDSDEGVGLVSGANKRFSLSTLRTLIHTGVQTIIGNIVHTGDQTTSGKVTAGSFEGNGALITGVTAAGVGGSTSNTSLTLQCNADNSTPAAKIVGSKYSTDLFEADENGFSLKTGIPYSHADSSIPFDKDLDLQNNYLTRSQTILDIQPGPYTKGDGTAAKFSTGTPHSLDFEAGSFFLIRFRRNDLTSDGTLFGSSVASSYKFLIASPSAFDGETDTNGDKYLNTTWTCDTKWHVLVVTGKDLDVNSYLDGALIDTKTVTGGNLTQINQVLARGSTYGNAQISDFIVGNRSLDSTEAIAFSSNPQMAIDAADEGASNTDLTSGTLTIGRRYRIDGYVAGDDFTNTGAAANTDGTEWIATATTPTTWTNSSVIHQIGCTARYRAIDLNNDLAWKDSSGNGNHFVNSGCEILNRSEQLTEEVGTYTLANGDFGTWTSPTFTNEYKKQGGRVDISTAQTGGTIDPGAAGKYITGLPFAPSAKALGNVSNASYADLGIVQLLTDGKIYFSDDIGAETGAVINASYFTEE